MAYASGSKNTADTAVLNTTTGKEKPEKKNYDLNNDGETDINTSATTSGVNTVFSKIKSKIEPHQNLFVFITDHGDPDGNIVLWNDERMSVKTLTKKLKELGPEVNIQIVTNICYGGKLTEIDLPNVCVVANADNNNESISLEQSDTFTDGLAHQINQFKSENKNATLDNLFFWSRKKDLATNTIHRTTMDHFLDTELIKFKIEIPQINCTSMQSPIAKLVANINPVTTAIANIDTDQSYKTSEVQTLIKKQKLLESQILELTKSWSEGQYNELWIQLDIKEKNLISKWDSFSDEKKEKYRGKLTLEFEKIMKEKYKQEKIALGLKQDLERLKKEADFFKIATPKSYERYKSIRKCLNHTL